MATPRNTGLFDVNGEKESRNGFGCMKLIEFLTKDGITDWDQWHYRHNQAERGECHYKDRCPIYEKTANMFNINNPRNEDRNKVGGIRAPR